MNFRIISFTKGGRNHSLKVRDALVAHGYQEDTVTLYTVKSADLDQNFKTMTEGLSAVIKDGFEREDALIFIGAAGICIRGIAPFLKDKRLDPPVLCLDEAGTYVIPLLSGHVGGANRLARLLAGSLSAEAVITTATDINGLFAVDEWATAHKLFWSDKVAAKAISASLLDGEEVGLVSDFPILGEMPKGIVRFDRSQLTDMTNLPKAGMVLSLSERGKPFAYTLNLIPKIMVVGMGCRKGIPKDILKACLVKTLSDAGISQNSISEIASIDLKKEEQGLLQLSQENEIPIQFYSAEQLDQVQGITNYSDFVRSITGVDNVCERAALLASEGGSLLVEKKAGDGVTIAIAQKEWRVCFEY